MNELKDCPFCGKQPKVFTPDNNVIIIMCFGNDCDMVASTKGSRKMNLEQSIEAWNTRINIYP